jgi:hypothetical protein
VMVQAVAACAGLAIAVVISRPPRVARPAPRRYDGPRGLPGDRDLVMA